MILLADSNFGARFKAVSKLCFFSSFGLSVVCFTIVFAYDFFFHFEETHSTIFARGNPYSCE